MIGDGEGDDKGEEEGEVVGGGDVIMSHQGRSGLGV